MSKAAEKRCCIVLYAVLFVFFCWFVYQLPFEIDDWAWGSQIGLDRLAEGFARENGRYAGNLAILVILRSTAVRVVLLACVNTAILFGLSRFFSREKGRSCLSMTMLCFLLFFAIPKKLFAETYAWFSGYTNYVLPLPFLIFSCVLLWRSLEEGENARLRSFWPLLPLGFLDCLFAEHNSVYVLALAAAAGITIFWKKRRLYWPQLLFLAGALAGAFLMFSNPSYIGGGAVTEYKSMSFSPLLILRKFFGEFLDEMFFGNLLINLLLGLAAVLLLERALRENQNSRQRSARLLALFLLFAFLSYDLLCAVEPGWTVLSWPGDTMFVNGLFSLLFMGTVCAVFLTHVQDTRAKGRMAFFFCSAVFVVLPLLVADPVEPRCFLTSYCFLGCFAVEAFTCALDQLSVRFNWGIVLLPGLLVSLLFYFSIFEDIGKANRGQLEHMYRDVESGETEIYLDDLPYKDFFPWMVPPGEEWVATYKDFYGLPEDVTLHWD